MSLKIQKKNRHLRAALITSAVFVLGFIGFITVYYTYYDDFQISRRVFHRVENFSSMDQHQIQFSHLHLKNKVSIILNTPKSCDSLCFENFEKTIFELNNWFNTEIDLKNLSVPLNIVLLNPTDNLKNLPQPWRLITDPELEKIFFPQTAAVDNSLCVVDFRSRVRGLFTATEFSSGKKLISQLLLDYRLYDFLAKLNNVKKNKSKS